MNRRIEIVAVRMKKKSVRVEIKKRKRKKEHKIISKYKLIKKKIRKI